MRDEAADDPRAVVGRLYDQHGAVLYRYALLILADGSAAEDVIQQVFTALVSSGRLIDTPEHYLRRAVRNECYSALRRRRVWRHAPVEVLAVVPAAPDARPEERIALERALTALPPEQREVLHLHVYEGMTFQEIATVTGESINTTASRYRYALQKLREALTK